MRLRALGLVVCVILLLVGGGSAQSAQPATSSEPGAGEIRGGTYFNYFLGLSYAIPEHWSPNLGLRMASDPRELNLLFLASRKNPLQESALVISAEALNGVAPKKYLDRKQRAQQLNKFKRIELAGTEYFRADADNVFTPYHVWFVCFRKNYALTLALTTTEKDILGNAEQVLSPLRFTDLKMPPEFAELIQESELARDAADHGAVLGQVYSNNVIGFAYQYPQGWAALQKSEMQKVAALAGDEHEDADAKRGPEHERAADELRYLFEAVEHKGSPVQNTGRVAIATLDLLDKPEIRNPVEMLAAVNLMFGSAGQHSRRAWMGKVDGQQFAAQELVLSGRDAGGNFVSRYAADFVTVVGRTGLVFVFVSPTQNGLQQASRTIGRFHRTTAGARPLQPAPQAR